MKFVFDGKALVPEMGREERSATLRGINEVLNPASQQPAMPPVPNAPWATMNEQQREVAFANWTRWIDSRPTSTWNREEAEAMRYATVRVLREMEGR